MSVLNSPRMITSPIYLFQRKKTVPSSSAKKGLSLSLKKYSLDDMASFGADQNSKQLVNKYKDGQHQKLIERIRKGQQESNCHTNAITSGRKKNQLSQNTCKLKKIVKLEKSGKENTINVPMRSIKLIVKPKPHPETQQIESFISKRVTHTTRNSNEPLFLQQQQHCLH